MTERDVKRKVHEYIWRTRPVCQLCGGRRREECVGLPDEMHEEPWRSKTRGQAPGVRFNLLVCGRLCAACHRDVHAHRIAVEFVQPALGFLGPVRAVIPIKKVCYGPGR